MGSWSCGTCSMRKMPPSVHSTFGALDQEHGLVADLGGDGDGDVGLVQVLAQRAAFRRHVDVDLRGFALQIDGGSVGDLYRQILDVEFLDIEYGLQFIGHDISLE